MANKDYTKFSNHRTNQVVEPVTKPVVEEVAAVVTEPVVEPVTKPVVEEVAAVVVEPVVEPIAKRVMGIVTDCVRLNVRMKPQPNATVISVVDVSTDLEIDEKASTKDYYKVYTATGIEGFCMKKFVTIVP